MAHYKAVKITLRLYPQRPTTMHIVGLLEDGSASLHHFCEVSNKTIKDEVGGFQDLDYDPEEMARAKKLAEEGRDALV